MFRTSMRRLYGPIRELIEFCDFFYLTSWERELKKNVTNFRKFVKMLVDERRIEMTQPNFTNKGDLLNLLLTEDIFKNNDTLILDECVAFLIASTNATSLLISNTIYYLTQFEKEGHLAKVRSEFEKVFNRTSFNDVKNQEWLEMVNYESISQMNHFSNCISETLRVDTPPISFGIQMTEPVEIFGTKISDQHQILINIHGLHFNEEEWIDPERWIPERFNPESPFYLTPKGTKRHPMSYGPFLGGKRVCLGKTFAENMTRQQLAIILTQLDFKFADPDLY